MIAVVWSKRSRDDLRGLPADVQRRVIDAMVRYAGTRHGDVTALKGRPGEYRLRVGDWRVLFALDAGRGELLVQRVRHRREAYRE